MTTHILPKTLRILAGGPFQRPSLAFEPVFRSPDHPRAVRLRETYRLREVAGSGDDFNRARRLKTWLRKRWNHGWDNEAQQDALDILARAASGGSFNCPYYSRVYVQCCLAIGLPARQMGVYRRDVDFPDGIAFNGGHAVSEVYCRELRKWVMLDADANAFYVIDGVPANCHDVHRAWHENGGRKLRQVLDKPRFVTPTRCPVVSDAYLRRMWKDFVRHQTHDFYHHIHTQVVNGFAQPPKTHTQRFLWSAGTVQPLLASNYGGIDPAIHRMVESETDFNWPINQTFIQATMAGKKPVNRIEIRLQHNMPFFDHFEVSIANGAFARARDAKIITLPSGKIKIRARAVDVCGKAGHETTILVELRPLSNTDRRLRTSRYWL